MRPKTASHGPSKPKSSRADLANIVEKHREQFKGKKEATEDEGSDVEMEMDEHDDSASEESDEDAELEAELVPSTTCAPHLFNFGEL